MLYVNHNAQSTMHLSKFCNNRIPQSKTEFFKEILMKYYKSELAPLRYIIERKQLKREL